MLGLALSVASILLGVLAVCELFDAPFEDALPLVCMGIVLALFVPVLVLDGHLGASVVAVFVLLVVAGLVALVHARATDGASRLCELVVTPGFLAFACLFLVLLYMNYGRLASKWDEFSHWMDVVKAMVFVDDFVTNPLSFSRFVTYPPAASLLQCYVQLSPLVLRMDRHLVEWSVYLTHQVFCVALLMPVVGKVSGGGLARSLVAVGVAVLLPLVCLPDYFYTTVYIDGFVAVSAAAGFLVVLTQAGGERWRTAYVTMLCATLVLEKAIGTFYAAMVALAFVADRLLRARRLAREGDVRPAGRHFSAPVATEPAARGMRLAWLVASLAPAASTALAKLLWDQECASVGATSTVTQGADFLGYAALWFTHGDQTYRQTVIDSYKEAIAQRAVSLGMTGVAPTYLVLMVCLIALAAVLCALAALQDRGRAPSIVAATLCACASLPLFVYGLGATYVSRFSEYEATRLASFERYMGSAYLVLLLFVALAALWLASNAPGVVGTLLSVALLALSVACAPAEDVASLATRSSVASAADFRAVYAPFSERILAQCAPGDDVYFVSQGSSGLDFWVVRFGSRPVVIDNYPWSLGPAVDEGDVWSEDPGPEAWIDALVEGGFEYVAVYRSDDRLSGEYAPAFQDPSSIGDETLYRVDPAERLLVSCG